MGTVSRFYTFVDGKNAAGLLTATGWAAIGNGLGTHAFHTTGTGEMDASSWVTFTAGYHVLEVSEPESGFGTGIRAHLDVS